MVCSQVNETERVQVSGTIYEWTEDEKNRPTTPVWNHRRITLEDAVVDAMKKNNLIRNVNVYS